MKTKKDNKEAEIEIETKKAKKDMFLEYVPYLIIIAVVLIIRLYIATPVRVNGTSMKPTLENGDIMLLYKLQKHIKGIERFDIVVIDTDSGDLIKRVIGLPGETIKYRIEPGKEEDKGVLYVNDVKVKETFIDDATKVNTCRSEWEICEGEIVVPEGEYFVMGDNRFNSKDSRMIGTVKKGDISGIVKVRLFPFSKFGTVK